MHYSDIDHEAVVQNADADLEDSIYGDRPILLEGFAVLDGCDLLVPVDGQDPESRIVAMTEEQGIQALLVLADQIGYTEAITLINKAAGVSQ